jgi:hypothetical protein
MEFCNALLCECEISPNRTNCASETAVIHPKREIATFEATHFLFLHRPSRLCLICSMAGDARQDKLLNNAS